MGSELGRPAKSEYLRFLKSRQEKLPLQQLPISRKVFVSRRKARPMQRVNEISQVEEFLIGCGYQEFFPELTSIATQLSVYAQATHLVFEAGSAIHGLELLGNLQARVAVIRRSTSKGEYWKGIVEPRGGACFEFTELIDVSPLKGTTQRGRSLSLTMDEFKEFLYKHEFLN
jgi:capsular polysaccharide biosynthesis protein